MFPLKKQQCCITELNVTVLLRKNFSEKSVQARFFLGPGEVKSRFNGDSYRGTLRTDLSLSEVFRVKRKVPTVIIKCDMEHGHLCQK